MSVIQTTGIVLTSMTPSNVVLSPLVIHVTCKYAWLKIVNFAFRASPMLLKGCDSNFEVLFKF